MTISTTAIRSTGQGNGATTVFSYNFLIPVSGDEVITFADTTGAQTVLGHGLYTITGLGNAAGGTVTYPLSGSPMTAGQSVIIERRLPLKQLTNLSNQSGYYPKVVEDALDYQVMVAQQLAQQLSDLNAGTVVQPSTFVVSSVTQARALSFIAAPYAIFVLGRDGGTFRRNPLDKSSAEDGGAYCGTIIRDTNYATAGVWQRSYSGPVDLAWYGGVPGSDCLAALTLAAATGKTVQAGPGTWPLAISGNGVTFSAAGQGLIGAGKNQTIFTPTGAGAFFLKWSGGTEGGWIDKFSVTATGMSAGIALDIDSHDRFTSFDVLIDYPYNGVLVTNAHGINLEKIRVSHTRGAYGVLFFGDNTYNSGVLNLDHAVITSVDGNTTTNCIVMDGDAHTLRLFGTQTQFGRRGLWVTNSGSGPDPSGVQGVDFETNLHTQEGIRFEKGSGYHFWYPYVNNINNTHTNASDGIYIAAGVDDVQISDPNLVGMGHHGINANGSNFKLHGGLINGAGYSTAYTYSGVYVGPTAAGAFIDGLSTNAGSGPSAYGVDIASGALDVTLICGSNVSQGTTTNSGLDGGLGAYRDQSGIARIVTSMQGQSYPAGSMGGSYPVVEAGTPVTNLLLDNADLTTANWIGSNATVTQVASACPDGRGVMFKVAEDNTNNSHFVRQTIALAASSLYTVGVMVKPIEDNYAALHVKTKDGTVYVQVFSLQGGGSVGGNGGGVNVATNQTIVPLSDGCYWISYTFNSLTGGIAPLVQLRTANSKTSTTAYVGTTGNGVAFKYPVLVLGPVIPNGLIPTGATARSNAGGTFGRMAVPPSLADLQVPTTGFSIIMQDWLECLALNPAGTLATGAVALPVHPKDGQEAQILSTQIVTTLTVTATQTILGGGAITIPANGSLAWKYNASITTWLRTK